VAQLAGDGRPDVGDHRLGAVGERSPASIAGDEVIAASGEDLQTCDVVGRSALGQAAGAAGVVADHPADRAVVEPGTVQAVLQRAVVPHGMRFGPDSSTHNCRARLGVNRQDPVEVS
jgi:hypothetical protein